MAIASRRGSLALGALVAAIVVACGGDTPRPPPTPATTPAASPTATTTASPPATPDRTATAAESPTQEATPTPAPTPSPTPSATQAPVEYLPLTMGEPRPLPPGATLYFRQSDSCHGPVWWSRAVATETGSLAWDNPFAKLPSIHADDWGSENWPPQLEGVSASGRTVVAEVCERGACQSFDHVDPDAARGVWGSVDAGKTWERWGDYPEGGVFRVKEGDVAFRGTDGRLKGFRSGEAWVTPERLPRPWVRSSVDGRLGHEEREPGQLDRFLHHSDQGAVLGAYSWGGEESYESHRPLWIKDHLEGALFVGFLGSEACGDATQTVLVDFGSGTVHPIPGLDPGGPILHKALLTEPPPPHSATPIRASEPRPALAPFPTSDGPPGAYTDIAVGFSGACALTEDATVVCWDIENGDVWDTPPGLYTFIIARDSTWCAITDGGAITCWGKGGGPVPEHHPDPSRDAPPGRFSALSFSMGIMRAGSSYVCALSEAGEPVCWGPEDGLLPPPDLPPGGYSAISLDLYFVGESDHFTAILTACATIDGDLVCWRGSNEDGEVEQAVEHSFGDYADAQVLEHHTCVVRASGGARCAGWAGDGSTAYTALAAGDEFVCAVTEAGGIECADHGLFSQSIAGYEGSRAVMQPPALDPDRRYKTVSVSSAVFQTHACALTESGEVDCWRSTANKVAYPHPPPARYVAVSDGLGHTCALTEDGQVLCWGWNNYGQADVPEGSYTAVSAGFAGTCAVTETGEAVCWGHGQPQFSTPTGERYRGVSTGYRVACALTEGGELTCVPGPADVPPGPFESIALSWTSHLCGVNEGGEVACWGANQRGELEVPPGSWKAIDVGDFQTCGIDDAGRGVCWGARSGQLPDAPTGRYVAIATSGYNVCLLTDAGQVYCRDKEDLESGVSLRRLDVDARVAEISVGLHRGCALTEAGSVTCWGDVEYLNAPFLNRHGYQPRW